jgi:hypothetical protein
VENGKIGNNTFHYQNTINRKNKGVQQDFHQRFEITINKQNNHYYCTDNIIDKKLIGVDYKSDYNGRTESVWFFIGDRKIIVFGNNNSTFNEFDPRLISRQIKFSNSKKQSKQPVDEGCAYLTVEVGALERNI